MKKETYNEAQSLQSEIEFLNGENRMLQDARDQIDSKGDTDFTVFIEGVEPKHELMDTIDERITSNNQKITKLTNKFDAL